MKHSLVAIALSLVATPALADELPTASAAAEPTVGYEKGFFVKSADGLYSLAIQGRVQGRFEHERLENGDGDHDSENAFSIARARLTLKGNVFEKNLKYKFQTDFGKGAVVLKDFLLDYRLGDGPWVRVGQWKRPFSRQQINSSGKLELVDRAITDKAFGSGRDIGVALHNGYEKSPPFEWTVGVFNASSADKPSLSGDVVTDMMTGDGEITGGKLSNVPNKIGPAAVVRVGYNHNGIKGYQEADLEGGPLRFGVGASVLSEFDLDDDDSSGIRSELDYIVKVNGLSTTGGVYVATSQDDSQWRDQAYAATGFHVQLGYVLAGKYQPAVRYAMVAPDGPDNNRQEITAGVSVYEISHNFKWQTDVGALIEETVGGSLNDIMARTQLQLAW